MRYILVTSVMLRDAYVQRVEKIGNKCVPIMTYDISKAKTFRSELSACKLASAIYWTTFREYHVSGELPPPEGRGLLAKNVKI